MTDLVEWAAAAIGIAAAALDAGLTAGSWVAPWQVTRHRADTSMPAAS